MLNRDQFHYPEDSEHFEGNDDFAFGRAYKAYGRGHLTDLFGGGAIAPTPWPSVGKTKAGLPYDKNRVQQVLSQPPVLDDYDPRKLHATQPSVLRHHAEFYRGSSYSETGQTSADQDNVGNRYPVVYHDSRGRNLLLSGHHRAVAALVEGKPLRARTVTED